MSKLIDLTGKTFGRLKVIKRADDYVSPNGNRTVRWLCECSCGKSQPIIVVGNKLKNGWTKSCGCLREETISKIKKKYNV